MMPPSLRRLPLLLAICLVLTTLVAAPAGAQGEESRYRVLVFVETSFTHAGEEAATAVIENLGSEHDFAVDVVDDSEGVFTDEGLAPYDAIIFNSNNGIILDDDERHAFERYIHRGGGYVGIHSASNSDTNWEWYTDLLAGGRFLSHPEGALQFQDATLVREDPDHPSTENLPETWTAEEEWYNYPVNPRDNGAHVLLTVDEATYEEQDGNDTDDDHPISWCNNFDGGRVWYTALGHHAEYWESPELIEHLRGGIEWSAGAVEGDCGEPREGIPTDAAFEKIPLDDNTANPMELAIAEDGRVFYVEFYGTVKMYDPVTNDVSVVGEIEVNNAQENGLLGIALDPDFMENNWIYLFYTAPSPEEQHVSRFTFDGEQLDMDSEQILLTIPHQREICCHSAGSLQFGPDGNLFISTGDDTAWFDSDGYSPHDDRVRGDPSWSEDARQAYDASRTAGNTNDLRGKILRITPTDDGGYEIPEGNLFPESEDPGDQTRPEIYTMGHRNPFRIAVDQETGWVYNGEVGPDSNVDNLDERGPRGYDEWNQIREAGNYGWPFCIADNKPYVEYDWATEESGEPFDCENGPTNTSQFNDGLEQLPPAQEAFVWYPYGSSPDFPEIPSGGGRAAYAGAVYHYDENILDGAQYPAHLADGQFPEYYDEGVFVMEWSRNVIGHITLDEQGNYAGFEEFMPDTLFRSPHDMAFGPDGNMYLIEWGIDFNYAGEGVNPDSGLYRISYAKGESTPVAEATADVESGPTPLEVTFSSEGTHDPDDDEITYLWEFGDGTTSTDPNPTHTYTDPGTYQVQLTVTDDSGRSGTSNLTVTAGNTEPEIAVEVPPPGSFYEWGDELPYEVVVNDAEDGSGDDIDCERVTIQLGIFHGGDDDPHVHPGGEQTGCSGTVQVPADSGHDASARIAFTIQAAYTDLGGEEGAPALTGTTLAFFNPKTLQAEHHADSDGTEVVEDSGAVGDARVGSLDTGDWISFDPVDLGEIAGIGFDYAASSGDGVVEVRLDAPDGELLGSVSVPSGDGQALLEDLDAPAGSRAVYFVVGGGEDAFELDQLHFMTAEDLLSPRVTTSADPTSGWAPLTVAFSATAEHPTGDDMTFEWDFGDGSTSSELNPTHEYAEPGTYQARFTATDSEGRTGTAFVAITVTQPPANCDDPTEPPPPSDEFDGTELDGCRWTKIVRENTEDYEVSDGSLKITADPGDMFGGNTSAENLVLQPIPDGQWTVETQMTYEATANYQQAGLILYGDDDNWAKFGLLYINGRVIEYVWQEGGSPDRDVVTVDTDFPDTVYMRLTSDGSVVTAEYSTDGESWSPMNTAVELDTLPDPHVGMFAFRANTTAPENAAAFEYFRVDTGDPGEDETPPTVTASLAGDTNAAGDYVGAATVTLTAADSGGSGVDRIEYQLDGGEFVTYDGPFTVSDPGDHVLGYHAFDNAGNMSQHHDLEFTVVADDGPDCDPEDPPGPNDEFDGAELDPCRWTQIVRENPEGYALVDGVLSLTAAAGDMFGGTTDAENIILQPVADGEWTVETEMSYEAATNYQQAGLMLYDDDDNWAKFGLLHLNERVLEYVWQSDGTPRRDTEDWMAVGTEFPSTFRLRLSSDGQAVTASYSTDDGETWQSLGRSVDLATMEDPHVGFFAAAAGGAPENEATFEYFRLVEEQPADETPPTVTADVSGDGTESVSVALTADDGDGSGVDSVEYRLDDGDWTIYSETLVVTAPGDHTLEYRATDAAGNTSAVGSVEFTVAEPPDETPPTVEAEVSGDGSDTVTVSVTADDGDGSGVETIEYRLDGGDWTVYTDPIEVTDPGAHTVEVRATDADGNVSEPESVSFTVAEPAACPEPDDSETVMIGDYDSGVPNRDTGDGCTIDDLLDDEAGWSSRGQLIRHVQQVAPQLMADGVIDGYERGRLTRAAARSGIGSQIRPRR